MIADGHQGVLVTLVERKSRYTLAAPLLQRTSAEVGQTVIALLRPHKAHCKTITFGNGKKFAEHAFMEKCLGATVYFAHPTALGSERRARTTTDCCASTSPRR